MIKHMLKLIWNKRKKNTLLFVEIFFCFLIVWAIAAFATRNFRNYLTPLGYEVENLWHVNLSRSFEAIDSVDMISTRESLKNAMEAIPGVEHAAFGGMAVPFGGSMWMNGNDDMGFEFRTNMLSGDADYQDVFDFELVEGRWFTPEDTLSKYRPVVVNRRLREEYFRNEPILDSILILDGEWRITGVVDHYNYRDGFEEEQALTIFYTSEFDTNMPELYLRVVDGSGGELEETIISELGQILKTEDIVVNDLDKNRRALALQTWILIVVGLIVGGFLIVNIALGLFGVLFYSISKRRPEIGLRRAMGASKSSISGQFTTEVYLVALAAMLLASLFTIQVPLLGLLGDVVRSADAYIAMFIAFCLISLVVLTCAYLPARSAAGLHPAEVLHEN
ncbi:MAG: ABC transporter permease [Bacteroidota bacterium]